ncbi:MAG: hypothetical protein KDK76_01030, partial [Chlamydiia bacterium]|nr:hypothetical protein [Chlamydiia bacterium]
GQARDAAVLQQNNLQNQRTAASEANQHFAAQLDDVIRERDAAVLQQNNLQNQLTAANEANQHFAAHLHGVMQERDEAQRELAALRAKVQSATGVTSTVLSYGWNATTSLPGNIWNSFNQ